MTFAKIVLLAMAAAAVPLHVGDTVAIVTGNTICGKALAVKPGGLAQAQQSPENLIHVEINGLRGDKGQVLCALYSSADGFPKKGDKAVAHAKSPISDGHAVCEFSGVTVSTYAVSSFHHEHSTGKLHTHFLALPPA